MSILLCLPEEIVLDILMLLSPLDVRSCQQVCHALNAIVTASPRLLFFLALDSLGYRLPSVQRSDIATSESLKLLQEHYLNWLHPNNIQPTQHTLSPHPVSSKYTGGVYAQSFGTSGFLGTNSTITGLEFHQIPSKNLDTRSRRWTLENLGSGVQDFIFDPDQDLLALIGLSNANTQYSVTCSVHLRTMSKGEAHPRALAPILEANFGEGAGLEDAVPNWGYHFEVVDELIGILFRSRSKQRPSWVVVWDWVRGIEVTRVSTAGGWHSSFILLDQQTILLPKSSDPRYTSKFSRNNTFGSIEVHIFDPRAKTSTPPRMVSSFSLPSFDRKYARSTLRLHCTPNIRSAYQYKGRPKVYESSSEYPIVGIDVHLSQLQGSGQITDSAGTLYVPAGVFLDSGFYTQRTSLFHNIVSRIHTCSATEVPWYQWARHVSWANTGDSQANGDCSTYGYRMGTLSNRVGIMNTENQINLLDFNQRRLRIKKATTSRTSSRISERHSLGSMFSNGDSSPMAKYTETVLEVETGIDVFDKVILDDEHVIIVRKGRLGTEPSLLVYTF